MADLADILEPCPCDTCRHAPHCAETGEACRAFIMFSKGKRWDPEPTQPRADIGKRLGLLVTGD